ncbi:unnamed protein product (macronuclear) [Paramecium tetraurelia]|uniref:Lebercilin domain-containing protein n=1 Tax=Paramecium tetraurelia TaxID=5888 RepID=A0BMY5_PARTE|nr:uncharacterized protein GSPATT00030539001 [Paramecium tetraurelia]CAK59902.1 unnamed protein product [Paramecium tetraurelia]|eukprot:XP_001427300.1 hypothetical protein (macronuclear) [Paramecium tetraurelia strain d4-2]
MSSMQFRMKNSRPITTNGTRMMESSANMGSKLMYNYDHPISKQLTSPKFSCEYEVTQEEIRQLKLQLNASKKESSQAKSRILYLEKELQRYENLVEEHSKTANNNDTTKLVIEKAAIVQKLRAKHKQLVQELLEKTKEIAQLKKSTKYTTVQELEIEVQNYGEENQRLREKLEYYQSIVDLRSSKEPLEKKIIQYEKTYKIIHKDNQELLNQIKQLENQNKQQKQKIEQLNKEISSQQTEIYKYQESINELQSYNERIQAMLEEEKQNEQQPSEELRQECFQQIETLKSKHTEELDEKNKEIRDLNAEIYKQTLHIQELEKLLEQYEESIKEKQSSNQSPMQIQKSF